MATSGVSGIAVAVAAVGGFLVYAGIKDIDLVTGLREIVGGKAPTGRPQARSAAFDAGKGVAGIVGNVAAGTGGSLVTSARAKLGKPYVFGATGPNAYDCSGLVIACLRDIGYNGGKVPRFTTHTFAAWARSKGWIKVDERSITAGDIVLKSGHMGIAISNAEMIHSPHTGTVVKVGKIYTPRYMWSGWRMVTKEGPPQYG
jgi:cell wall-associated NlpC family hydrolase